MSTPQDFDIDAWLNDAERPARSVTVYQKAGLIAELDALEEKIENAEADEAADLNYERGLGEMTESQKLRAEYAKVAKRYHESALVITLEGRSDTERMEIARANPGVPPTQLGYIAISDAILSPKMTPAQLEKLEAKLGELQFQQVIERFQQASTEIPVVSADFLPKPSIPDDGGE